MEPSSDRLSTLQKMLAAAPRDTFLLYGLGMEYKKLGDYPKAIESFDAVLAVDPGYCYAYYQRAQVNELMEQPQLARQSYREGIAAARRVGDAHALSELEAALELLG